MVPGIGAKEERLSGIARQVNTLLMDFIDSLVKTGAEVVQFMRKIGCPRPGNPSIHARSPTQ